MFFVFDAMIWVGVFAIGACFFAGLWLAVLSIGRGGPPVAGIRPAVHRAARHGNAACGRCAHDVPPWDAANPPATKCPECGGTYARVGVVTPAAAARLGPPLWLPAGLLVFPAILAAFLAFMWAYAPFVPPPPGFQPAPPSQSGNITIAPTRDRPPDPLAYILIIDYRLLGQPSGSQGASGLAFGWLSIMATGPNITQLTLDLDLVSDEWRLNPAGKRGRGIESGIDALFTHTGLDQRRYADAERHEAREYAEVQNGILSGATQPSNGFLATGNAGEAGGPDDLAMMVTRASMSNSGGGLAMAPATSVPFHGVVLASLAGAVPPLIWASGIALLWRARRRVLAG